MSIATKTNRLAQEKSPYLLQHQHNPVDWHPWGGEAFAKARAEDKPIFLSIGYSTCHWCHVMERESFENEETAEFLNANFVSIKVDREERPDVDKIYMTAVQAMTGQGGWPLNCVLTPELKPFFGGTYFPPETRHGRLGFVQILEEVRRLWDTRRGEIVTAADELQEKLRSYTTAQVATLAAHPTVLTNAAMAFMQEYDPQNGGFGTAPKFPSPSLPLFLLRYGARFGDHDAAQMVLHTCDRMAAGGIFDQIGGGFHRYSVDAQWLTPHFEKMLYDNAQLVQLYLDAFLYSRQPKYAETAQKTLDYVLREMTDPEGGFYSAEDADSEGKEGKFYCWTLAELTQLLEPAELAVVVRSFGVTEQGNFVDHSDPNPLSGQNILSIVDLPVSAAEELLLESAKAKMFQACSQRIRPHRDDKVLTSWNGMMLGAMARASAVLGKVSYRKAAEKNLAFLKSRLWNARTKTLYHRWRDGAHDQVQLLNAYANLVAGTIELYEATLDPAHLDFAVAIAESMLTRFHDPEAGGFFQTAADTENIILRVKEDYDGAEPSGNSLAALGLLKLASITSRDEFRAAAESVFHLFAHRLRVAPHAVPHLLQGLDFMLEEPGRAVVTGDWRQPATAMLLRFIHSVYQPHKIVMGNHGKVDSFTKTLPEVGGPQVYVCTSTKCNPPTRDAGTIKTYLKEPAERLEISH